MKKQVNKRASKQECECVRKEIDSYLNKIILKRLGSWPQVVIKVSVKPFPNTLLKQLEK